MTTGLPTLKGSFWSDIRLAYGLLPVVNLLEKRGIDPEPLLGAAGIDRFGLLDPGYTIAIERELALMRGAIKALADPTASLALAQEYRVIGFSVLGLAMLACDTPLQILRLLLRYPRLAWGVFDCELRSHGDTVEVELLAPPVLGAAEGFLAERDIACAQLVFNEVLSAGFQFRALHFRHRCAGSTLPYTHFFDCPVSFGQPQFRLIVAVQDLTRPLPHANPALRSFYEAQCERMSRGLEQPFRFADAVRSRLRRSEVIPDLAALAASLHMTPRTVQRRLAAEHSSFSALLREVRRERAEQLLLETAQPMARIAAELGFSDAVAFSHAFKSWTGQAPALCRQKGSRRPAPH